MATCVLIEKQAMELLNTIKNISNTIKNAGTDVKSTGIKRRMGDKDKEKISRFVSGLKYLRDVSKNSRGKT